MYRETAASAERSETMNRDIIGGMLQQLERSLGTRLDAITAQVQNNAERIGALSMLLHSSSSSSINNNQWAQVDSYNMGISCIGNINRWPQRHLWRRWLLQPNIPYPQQYHHLLYGLPAGNMMPQPQQNLSSQYHTERSPQVFREHRDTPPHTRIATGHLKEHNGSPPSNLLKGHIPHPPLPPPPPPPPTQAPQHSSSSAFILR